MPKHETPRYRVVTDCVLYGIPRRRGEEFDYQGWPPKGVEGANDAGRAVLAYQARNTYQQFFPQTPYSQLVGGIFLSAALTRHPTVQISLIRDPREDDRYPLYRIKALNGVGNHHRQYGHGEIIAYLGWPNYELEPANEIAEEIGAYKTDHGQNPNLLPSPWCELNGVVLPDLPVPKGVGRTIFPERKSGHPEPSGPSHHRRSLRRA